MHPVHHDSSVNLKQTDDNLFWYSALASFCGTGAWIVAALFIVITILHFSKKLAAGDRDHDRSSRQSLVSSVQVVSSCHPRNVNETKVDKIQSQRTIHLSSSAVDLHSNPGTETCLVGTPASRHYGFLLDCSGSSFGHSEYPSPICVSRISLAPPFEGVISGENLKEIGFLGKGAFGTVKKVEITGIKGLNHFVAAFKTVSENSQVDIARDRAKAESEVLLHVGGHPNIIRLVGFCAEEQPSLLIEICARGSLENQLKQWFEIGINGHGDALQRIMVGICAGMQHIIGRNIVHRDLATRNVLLDEFLEPKIADFGLAAMMKDGIFIDASMIGLPAGLLALESFERREFSEKTDIWAFGLLVYDALTFGQQEAFPECVMEDPMELYSFLLQGHRPHFDPDWPTEATQVISSSLRSAPHERPTFKHLEQIFRETAVFRKSRPKI